MNNYIKLSKKETQYAEGITATLGSGYRTAKLRLLNISMIFIAILFLCFIANPQQIEAQKTIFDFAPSNFKIGKNADIFIEYYSTANGFYHYPLTDAQKTNIPYLTKTMWYDPSVNMLSLQTDFTFSCLFSFNRNAHSSSSAEGITFTLLTPRNCDALIGMSGNFLGYGWTDDNTSADLLKKNGELYNAQILNNSFAIEIDIRSDSTDQYDSAAYNCGLREHFSLLTNGDITSNCFNSFPINADGSPIIDMREYCFTVNWRRANGLDASDGFYLEVYWDGNLRIRMHYASVSDLVPGATDNVIWGLTASCTSKNPSYYEHLGTQQYVHFIRLENGDDVFSFSPFIFKLWKWCGSLLSPPPVGPLWFDFDTTVTLYDGEIYNIYDCYNSSNNDSITINGDTIFINVSPCLLLNSFPYGNCYSSFLIDPKGKIVDSIFINGEYYHAHPYNGNYELDLNGYIRLNYHYFWRYDTLNTILIKFTDGTEYTIIIDNDNRKVAKNIGSVNPGIVDIDMQGNTGTIIIDRNILEGNIILPEIDDCNYILGNADTNIFDFPLPYIDSSVVPFELRFKLKNICENTQLAIELDCECNTYFNPPFILNIDVTSKMSDYFSKNADSLNMKIDGNNIEKLIDSNSQIILLPKMECLEMSFDTSLFAVPPQIIEGEKMDSLVFEVGDLCESVSISLQDTCSLCPDEEPITLTFYGADLSFHEVYSTCAGAKFGILNCGNPDVPSTIKCIYYRADSAGNRIITDTIIDFYYDDTTFIYDTLDSDIITDTGFYKTICYDVATGEILDSSEVFEVRDNDLEFPLTHSVNLTGGVETTSEGCVYIVSMLITIPIADTALLAFYDFVPITSSNLLIEHLGDDTSITNPNIPKFSRQSILKKYKISLDCNENNGNDNFVTFNVIFNSGGVNLLVCDNRKIKLPSCCGDFDCNDCLTLVEIDNSTSTAPVCEPITSYKKEFMVYHNCEKVLSKLEYRSVPHSETMERLISYKWDQDSFKMGFAAPCTGEEETITYNLFFTFEDGSICKKELTFSYKCEPCPDPFKGGNELIPATLIAGDPNGIVTITASLCCIPATPLRVSITDEQFNELILVSNDIPNVLEPIYYQDVDTLPSGNYFAALQSGNEELFLPFTIVDSSIIEYADITPNPTDGFTNINYILKELPNSQLRVRVIHEITGFEHITVFETPTKLQDRIELDVSSLMAGSYLVVLEVENSIFYLPVTLNIIKE